MTTKPPAPTADSVLSRDLLVRARSFRGKLLVARGETAVELDEVGAFLYKAVDGASTVAQIAEKLVKEYDVDADTALADTLEFIQQLCDVGILLTASSD